MPAVYDDEKQQENPTGGKQPSPSDAELRTLTGINPDQEGAMDREAHKDVVGDKAANTSFSPQELADAEASGSTPSGSRADKQEQPDTSGGWKTDVDNGDKKGNRLKSLVKSKKGRAGLGIATIGVTGLIGFSSFFGPTLFINHLREMLLTKVSSLQTHQSTKYKRKKLSKVSDMFSTDGRRGGKVIAEMQARGYEFAFDKVDNKRIVGITPPGSDVSLTGDLVGDHINDYLEVRHPLRTSRWKTKRMEAFYNRYKVTRTSPTIRADGDPEDPEQAVNKRVYNDIEGEEVPTETTGRLEAEEGEADSAVREELNSEHDTVARDSSTYDGIKDKLKEGMSLEELTVDEQDLLRMGLEVDEELIDLATRATAGSLSGKTLAGMKSMFSSTDILDKVCTLKNRIHAIQRAARAFRAISMLRYASSFIKVSDGIRAGTGKTDPKMLNALMKRVTATDRNGNNLGASPGMAYIIKGKFNKSKNDDFKGSFGVDGKLTGFPAAVQSGTNQIPGLSNKNCNIIQSPVTQIGVAAVELGIGIFSGGASKGASEVAKKSATEVFKASIKRLITKEMAFQVAKGVAFEIGFEAMLSMTQLYAERATAVTFTGQEVGGELGDVLGGGAGTLNKQRSLQAGMVPATATQYAQAEQTYIAEKAEEMKNQSLFARYLDYNNTDSLAFGTMTALTTSPDFTSISTGSNVNINNVASLFTTMPLNSVSGLFGLFTGKAHAQSDEDVSFDTLDVKGDVLATDPAGKLSTHNEK